MGYQPNGTAGQMQSINIWRVNNGKLIEHWDELNLLDVFMRRYGLTPAPLPPHASYSGAASPRPYLS